MGWTDACRIFAGACILLLSCRSPVSPAVMDQADPVTTDRERSARPVAEEVREPPAAPEIEPSADLALRSTDDGGVVLEPVVDPTPEEKRAAAEVDEMARRAIFLAETGERVSGEPSCKEAIVLLRRFLAQHPKHKAVPHARRCLAACLTGRRCQG